MIRVCFVCLGNICRSPTAEGVFRRLVEDAGLENAFEIDSAGTSGWHIGAPPDERSAMAARRLGYQLGGASRRFVVEDFDRFDHVIAMDHENFAELKGMARDSADVRRLSLLRSHDPDADGEEVPDPYYGGGGGFDAVVKICVKGCAGLLATLRRELAD